MRFLMIDRICSLEKGRRARGIKNISWNDGFLQEHFAGIPVFSPVIAIEAVAQLMSWLIIEHRGFSVKPVITVADSFSVTRQILPGDQLLVEGAVDSWSEESALASGRIYINGQEAIAIDHAVCFLYPLEELNSPEEARRSFDNLYREGAPLPPPGARDTGYMREHIAVPRQVWVDRVLPGDGPDRLRGLKNVTATADCFNDHFPRKPVLPGVMTMETMSELGLLLVEPRLRETGAGDRRPVLSALKKIKFRKFVTPGDQLELDAKLTECTADGSVVAVKALLNGRAAASTSAHYVHLDRQDYVKQFIA